MKIIKVGKYTVMRHWFRWYWMHQEHGGSEHELNWLAPVEFPKDLE